VTGSAGKLVNDNGSQGKVRKGGRVAGDGELGVGGGTLNQDLFFLYLVSLGAIFLI
jgi:hypothetical protein